MIMTKQDLMPNDILKFKNGAQVILSRYNFWVIDTFYDDDLKCLQKEEYDIEAVFRPSYDLVYSRINEITPKR